MRPVMWMNMYQASQGKCCYLTLAFSAQISTMHNVQLQYTTIYEQYKTLLSLEKSGSIKNVPPNVDIAYLTNSSF